MSTEKPPEFHDPDFDEFEDEFEEEFEFEFDCHMDRNGMCGMAGSEECEFDCPYREMKR
jgi:hypothetical protein